MKLKIVFLLVALVINVLGDVYLQNPRGSNNRLNGQGRDRRNANRLFDSENNARGGYNAAGLYYHVDSILSIEWTNQHSCSGPNNNCDLILQYMCNDKMRNGVSETTIRFPAKGRNADQSCENYDCDSDLEYGMNEDYNHYLSCYIRERNRGLFTADQDMKNRQTARFTRQDRNGARHGYECPEERDYYPYWGPSPWKDIAIMTSDTTRCDYYKSESANVKDRYHCVVDLKELGSDRQFEHYFRKNPVPITEDKCKNYENTVYLDRDKKQPVTVTGKWVKIPAHNIPEPKCLKAPESRDNHNGNGKGGFPNTYNWTIPDDVHDNCVLRLRYNISTGEFPWNTDSRSNGRNKNNQPCKACNINVGSQVNIDDKFEAEDRNYILTGNPEIHPMKFNGVVETKFELKLAINTAQFGRTFQDRSHLFSIKPRLPGKNKIYNLNVRGKRGNIVQTYPATEYDFVPNRLHIKQGDAVHIQWTGSDNNPGNNAGQGRARTDRSNIVQLTDPKYDAVKNAKADKPYKHGHWANNYPHHLSNSSFLGLNLKDRESLAFSGVAGPYTGDIDQMDDAGPYYDLGVRVINKLGVYRFMSSRNNAFTNRGQKGVIKVEGRGAADEQQSFADQFDDIEMLENEINDMSV